ncbi:GTP 3',8-cyclase MoaA [soil metagenome]
MSSSDYSIHDNYGRHFNYLRLSISDICNFRCQYCLPDGYKKNNQHFLSIDEIRRIGTAFSKLGLKKIRLTGGEPTLRKDLFEIAQTLISIPSIEKVVITTNGYTLPKIASSLYNSGIRGLNVSIDSLDRKIFKEITGHDKLKTILNGIEQAKKVGFKNIKVNVVPLKNINDDISPFLSWIKTEDISVRIIELMQNKTNLEFFKRHYVPAQHYIDTLVEQGWKSIPKASDAGPAQEFGHPHYVGRIGFIAPYSKDFCATCNRLRISARGELYLCLFGDVFYNLRPLLQSDDQDLLLKDAILHFLPLKHATHYLNEGNVGNNVNFSHIGG